MPAMARHEARAAVLSTRNGMPHMSVTRNSRLTRDRSDSGKLTVRSWCWRVVGRIVP